MEPITIAYADQAASQVMDVYVPQEGGSERPCLVVIHGGAFKFGDQRMPIVVPVIQAALSRGYVVASVDYRKSFEATFPAAVADVKAAVRYLRAHADTYAIDPDRIACWGESAGGYLALMVALTPTVAELDGDVTTAAEESSAVRCLAVFYPPVEFFTMRDEYRSWGDNEHGSGAPESAFLGVDDIYEDRDVCEAAHWMHYRDCLGDDFRLAAWVQVGDESDDKVPYLQSVHLAERLAEIRGVTVSFTKLVGAAHMDKAFYTDENLGRMLDFMDEAFS